MYRLYVDETGNPDLRASQDPNHRYLSLTGLIIGRDHVRDVVVPRLTKLKHEIFAPDPDEPIIFHRKEIVQRTGPFRVLTDDRIAEAFDTGLMTLLSDCKYRVITVVIDKLEHLNRYTVWRYDPYHYCLEVLVERYVLWLRKANAQGDIMGEVRGGKLDRRLEKAYCRLYRNGTTYIRTDVIQRQMTSSNIKLKQKIRNIAGLQLADLLAHPSALYVRSRFAQGAAPRQFGAQICDLLIRQKYNRSPDGKIEGWGIKWLP